MASAATPRLYAALGLQQTASPEEIKRSYRNLARIHHPDKNLNDPAAAEKFVEIQYAYSVLSDEHRRFIYDQHGEEATRKYEEATRQNHSVFSPNPALARKIWMVFFGIWLACVLLDPLLGISLEWYEIDSNHFVTSRTVRILVTFGLPAAFLYFFGPKNFPWAFLWTIVVDLILYFVTPAMVLAKMANILIYAALVLTISLLGAHPAFTAGSIIALGYFDIFWRTSPLAGLFMAAHSATAATVVLISLLKLLSEEGAGKFVVNVSQYFLPLLAFVPWWIMHFLDWLLPWTPWEWVPFVGFFLYSNIQNIRHISFAEIKVVGMMEIGAAVFYFLLPMWTYRYINSTLIMILLLWIIRIIERVTLFQTTELWFYVATAVIFLHSEWGNSRIFPDYGAFYGSQMLGIIVWFFLLLMALSIKVEEETAKEDAARAEQQQQQQSGDSAESTAGPEASKRKSRRPSETKSAEN